MEIRMPDGVAEAFVARPADRAEATHPGVLFYMDAIGLRPRIETMARRIADWGYLVMAPNVLYRKGLAAELAPDQDLRAPGAREAFFRKAMPRVRALTSELAQRDIETYVATLRGLDGVADGPVGVVGYCMGARLTVRTACAFPDVVAAAAGFHGGGLATDAPDSPHLGLGRATARFVFGHADRDPSMDATAVARLGEALDAAGLQARNDVYRGAAHGFSMDDTPSYDEAAGERSFAELRTLFADTLG